mmetsp:Transcript_1954/g.4599  ORF Transcript_1954/g.4599 Transcript_1954/m.4599 type:complete len:103 (-) Transcript_1954:183-491(-)
MLDVLLFVLRVAPTLYHRLLQRAEPVIGSASDLTLPAADQPTHAPMRFQRLWAVAHFINFRFIPSSQRLLYINVVTIFWTTYLSWSSCQSGQGSGTEVKPVA